MTEYLVNGQAATGDNHMYEGSLIKLRSELMRKKRGKLINGCVEIPLRTRHNNQFM